MARKTNTKSNKEYGFDFANTGLIRGVVNKVLYEGAKINKYSIDVPTKTPNNKIAHAFVAVTEYSEDDAMEEGTKVNIEFHIATGSYKNKEGKKVYTTDIVADSIDEI